MTDKVTEPLRTLLETEKREGPDSLGIRAQILGGACRDRTGDLRNAIAALSQLS
jgi:hypothetical protein